MTEAQPPVESTHVTFTARPESGDIIANAAAYMRRTGIALAFGTFATASALLGILLAGDMISVVFLLFGLSFLSGLFVVPFVWWTIRRRRDLVLAPVEIDADDEGITMTASYATSRQAWSVYRGVRETNRAFVMNTGTGAAGLVTKRGVPAADVAAFRSLLLRVGVLRTTTGLRSLIRPLLWVAIGLVAAFALWFGPRAIAGVGATATMTISTEVGDDTVTISGETDLPDGAAVTVQAVQWDEWQRETADGVQPDVNTSPWVVSVPAIVTDGRFEATMPIASWPAGLGLAVGYFSPSSGQPAPVIDRFGRDGAGLKGPDVMDDDFFGPTLEIQEHFSIP